MENTDHAWLNWRGVWFKIYGDPGTDQVRHLMLKAVTNLQNLKDQNINDLAELNLQRLPFYRISTSFGRDVIEIFPEEFVEEGEVGAEEEFEEEEEITSQMYCLLVEMKQAGINNQNDIPEGFAVFIPNGAGHAPVGSLTEPVVNMQCLGYTTSMLENVPGEHDPPGIVDQPTYRLGWCKGSVRNSTVEQIRRVDQGFWAYDGDWDDEEVTAVFSEYVWTDEDIDYPVRWFSVDPGPNNAYYESGPSPNYSWGINPAYTPDPDPDWEEDWEWDIEHLFRAIIHPSGKRLSWWPPNFTQLINRQQQWHENNLIYRYIDYDSDLWDRVWDGGQSIGSALGSLLFPRGWGKHTVTLDSTVRYWGIVYPGQGANDTDTVVEPTDFPHIDYDMREDYWIREIQTDYERWFYEDGVYVKDRHREMFIIGLVLHPQSDFYVNDYIYVSCRTDRTPGSEGLYPAEDLFNNPEDLTEDQLAVLAGNEDLVEWNFGSGEGRFYRDGIEVAGTGWITINAGGNEFIITEREVTRRYNDSLNIISEYKTEPVFYDYGIFTKVGVGTDDDGRVDAATVDPIYAYMCRIRSEYQYGARHMEYEGIIYGIAMDDLHYRTEQYPLIPGQTFKARGYYREKNYAIPELEGAVNVDGELIYPKTEVRAGILTTTIRTPKTTVKRAK